MSDDDIGNLSYDEAFYLLVLVDGDTREHGDLYTEAERKWRRDLRVRLHNYLFKGTPKDVK